MVNIEGFKKTHMKTKTLIKFSWLLVAFLFQANAYNAQTYCAATNTDCGFEHITNFTLVNINNTSTCGAPYDDYSNQVAYLAPGQTYAGTITKSDIVASYKALIWVDWNHDGTFDILTEQIEATLTGTSLYNFTITPPAAALLGPARLRVRIVQQNLPSPCGSATRGDIEDYTVNLSNNPPPPPVNNMCANAISMTPTVSCENIGGSSINATKQFEQTNCSGNTAPDARDVWYKFVADGVASYRISVTGTGTFNPVLGLYSNCTNTALITCQDATLANQTETINTGALAAGTYYYRIYGNGAAGTYTTCVVDVTPQPGSSCETPLVMSNHTNFCSAPGRFNNNTGGSSFPGKPACWTTDPAKAVWFEFTASTNFMKITVNGAGINGNTLDKPQIDVYSGNCAAILLLEACANSKTSTSQITMVGLTIGTSYLLRVDGTAGATGTFQLCLDNAAPPIKPGQDCSTARQLCNKNTLSESNVTGYGNDGLEASGSCLAAGVGGGLNTEQNTIWYHWTAANNGTLTFEITPSDPNLDIDWVLYQLDPVNGCTSKTQLRCMGAGASDPNSICMGPTGLNATSLDVVEGPGCDPQNDNYLMQLTMVAGTKYGLLINCWNTAGLGYELTFGGTGTFQGPAANFTLKKNYSCTANKTVTFTNTSTNAATYQWSFGSGATPATATTAGPHTVTYNTPGLKTATLIARSANGCDSVIFKQFMIEDVLNATASVTHSSCQNSNGSIGINKTGGNGLNNKFTYSLNGGAYQASNVFNGLAAGTYSMSVKDSISCTYTFNVVVNTTLIPSINAITNVSSCVSYVLPNITGTNLTGNQAYYSATNGGGTKYSPGTAINTSMTLYAYDATTTVPVCSDEEIFTITINTSPIVSDVIHSCNGASTQFTVSFDVTGGNGGPYTVTETLPGGTGGSFTGNTWTSGFITNNIDYEFSVDDVNGCGPIIVSGNYDCACPNYAGTMNLTPMDICGNGAITATHNDGSINDDGGTNILSFVLHTNNGGTLGSILQTKSTRTFSFVGGMTYGTTYYISAIMGRNDGSGNTDITDPCLSVASGTPVKWKQVPTADFSGNASICEGSSTPLTFALTGVGPFNVTYSDGISNKTAANIASGATVAVSPTSTTTYNLVSVTSSGNGCSGTVAPTLITVNVTAIPTTTASAEDEDICEGDDLNLLATDSPGANYSWTGPDDFTSTDQNPTIQAATTSEAGTYTVTVSENGCSSTSSVDITANTTEDATIASSPAGPFCIDENAFNLTAATAGGTWTGSGITDPNSGTFNPAVAGSGMHGVTYSLSGSCPSTGTRNIEVNALPVPDFTATPLVGCSPVLVSFTNTTASGTSALWTFGDGQTSTDLNNVDHTYTAGNYTVSLTITNNACTSTISKPNYITISSPVIAEFSATNLDGLTSFSFENESSFATNYTWSFGDGAKSNAVNPKYKYDFGSEEYLVTLIAFNTGGCADTTSVTVLTKEDVILYVPNSFTPDGNSTNPYFVPVLTSGYNPDTYHMVIFNRWGNVIFESKDVSYGWDGSVDGQPAPGGIYIWTLKFSAADRVQKYRWNGTVNLMR
jgi:gliding motility-associated-like protein